MLSESSVMLIEQVMHRFDFMYSTDVILEHVTFFFNLDIKHKGQPQESDMTICLYTQPLLTYETKAYQRKFLFIYLFCDDLGPTLRSASHVKWLMNTHSLLAFVEFHD